MNDFRKTVLYVGLARAQSFLDDDRSLFDSVMMKFKDDPQDNLLTLDNSESEVERSRSNEPPAH